MTNKTKAHRQTDATSRFLSLVCLVTETALDGLLWGCLNFKGVGGESNSDHHGKVNTPSNNFVKNGSTPDNSVKTKSANNNFSKNEVGV